MQLIKQSESTAARKRLWFTAVSSADVQSRLDGSALTFTVRMIKADGTSVAGGGTVSQPDGTNAAGLCYYTPGGTDLDTVGPSAIRVSATGMEPREVPFVVVSADPFDAATGTSQTTIAGRLPAALVGGRMDSSVGAMAADVLTASALAADAVTEIVAAIFAYTVETGVSFVQSVRAGLALSANQDDASLEDGSGTFYAPDGLTARIVWTISNGVKTVVRSLS